MELILLFLVAIAADLVLRPRGRRRRSRLLPRPPRLTPKFRPAARPQRKPPKPAGPPPQIEATPAGYAAHFGEIKGRCWVIDGDTIDIQGKRLRLFGIDAPEMEHPYGRNAKYAMMRLCKGQVIRAVISDKDVHDRLVARCFLPDGTDLSAEMVRSGHAIDWPKFSGGIYSHLEEPGIRKRLWRCHNRQIGKYVPD